MKKVDGFRQDLGVGINNLTRRTGKSQDDLWVSDLSNQVDTYFSQFGLL